jgi:ankyrin repeat protein
LVKNWIDQGAAWPDELAGVAQAPPVDADAEQLATFIRTDDRGRIEALLGRNPGAVRARTSGGSTPLRFAALNGDATLMKRLIDLGAAPGASNVAGATALMWAVPDLDKMRLLLASDVNVDARSEDRRTAVVIAAGIVGSAPAIRLLLEYGASPFSAAPNDPSPLREAARVNNTDVFRLLLDSGADGSVVDRTFLRTTVSPVPKPLAAAAQVPSLSPLPLTVACGPHFLDRPWRQRRQPPV